MTGQDGGGKTNGNEQEWAQTAIGTRLHPNYSQDPARHAFTTVMEGIEHREHDGVTRSGACILLDHRWHSKRDSSKTRDNLSNYTFLATWNSSFRCENSRSPFCHPIQPTAGGSIDEL
jgi:hypothetical protein